MRATLALEDDLLRAARELTGIVDSTALIHEALKALVERDAASRLVTLGGTMSKLKNIPRRQLRERI